MPDEHDPSAPANADNPQTLETVEVVISPDPRIVTVEHRANNLADYIRADRRIVSETDLNNPKHKDR